MMFMWCISVSKFWTPKNFLDTALIYMCVCVCVTVGSTVPRGIVVNADICVQYSRNSWSLKYLLSK